MSSDSSKFDLDGRWLALLAAGTLAIGGAACQRRGSRKTSGPSPAAVKKAVVASLTDDLLKIDKAGRTNCPICGHCYVASEAAWHLLGRSDSGWVPASATWKGVTHWWLERDGGEILDVTADQFSQSFPYDKGQRRGFLTGSEPSERARIVIERARQRLTKGSRARRGSVYMNATVADSGYHRTTIASKGASAPLRHLTSHHPEWVKGSVLDFGSGRGRDCAVLGRRKGVAASCYDPHHPQAQRRRAPTGKHDLVTVIYVVNVLPPAERKKALKQAGSIVKKGGRIAIAARGTGDSQGVRTAQGWTKHGDGHAKIVDGEIRRFQRFFDRDTLLRESLSALGRSIFVPEDSLVPMPADTALVVLRRIG